MLKLREKWNNFALKFENYSESGRNRLQSRDRPGVERNLLNTGFSCPFREIWQPYPNVMKFLTQKGFVLQFLWHLFELHARMLAFTCFIYAHGWHIFLFIMVHFLLTFIWIESMESKYRVHGCSFVLKAVVAFTHIFIYYTSFWDNSKVRFVVFYFIIFVENTVLILVFNIDLQRKYPNISYLWHLLLIQSFLFILSLFFSVSQLFLVYFKRVNNCTHTFKYLN